MSPDQIFQIANPIALIGWIALVLSPLAPRVLGILGGIAIPLILSVGYTGIILAHWSSGQGGFDSLQSVEQLFQSRWLLLAGWVHYLAFDLLLGAWEVRTARREGITHLILLPCLIATFLFGPAGYLLFQFIRISHQATIQSTINESIPHQSGRFSLARLATDSPRYTSLAILLAVAIVPIVCAAVLDMRLFQGINVWIKPLKFHIALVIYFITLAIFARFTSPEIKQKSWWKWHERAIVIAVVLEMVWINGAASLGTGSHFNISNQIWAVMYSLMGLAAVLLTSATTSLAWAIHHYPKGNLAPAIRVGLVWGLGLTLPLTLITAGTLSGMGSHWIGGSLSDTAGLWLMGWSRDGGDLRVAHFFATHAMHVIPLTAIGLAMIFGRNIQIPVLVIALAYVCFVIGTFIQALMGYPFIGA
jgi:hypothetical protein